jgi:hypothetical protein
MTLTRIRWVAAILAAAMAGVVQGQVAEEASAPGVLQQVTQDLRLTTTVRLDYFQSSKELDDVDNLFGATLQLKALPRISDTVDGKIELRGTDADIRDRDGDADQSRMLEAYFTIHFAKADLHVGDQIVAWGRADGINPTDNLTPHDYVVPLPLEEDQRFGTTAVRLDAYLSQELTFTVFATPLFEPSRFPLPPGLDFIETRPARTASDSELALKLNRTGGALDWSISYFHGYSLLPSVAAIESAYVLDYNRIDVIGADVAHNFGRFGFRSEVAYTHPSDTDGIDPNVRNPRLFWVAGIDRTFLENLNIDGQFFVRWMPHYQAPEYLCDATAQNLATLNSIIDGQEARTGTGLTFRVSNKWFNDTLQAEVLTLINLTRSDYFLRPLLTYTFSDHIKGMLGGELYRGPKDTPYGIFESASGAFVELRYGF